MYMLCISNVMLIFVAFKYCIEDVLKAFFLLFFCQKGSRKTVFSHKNLHFAAQRSGQEQKIGLQTFERETTYRHCVANEVYKIVTPSFQYYAEPMRLLMVVQLYEYQNMGATTISLTDESKEQNTYLSFELVFELSYSSKGSS